MILRKKFFPSVLIFVFSFFIPLFANALNLNQIINLKKDGSGTITFQYRSVEGSITGGMVGNFPFTKEKVNEYFNTPATKVINSTFDKAANNMTQASVIITFSDVSKLGAMKVMTGSNVAYVKSDTAVTLRIGYPLAYVKANSLENLYIGFKSDASVKSTNGQIKDNAVTFFRAKQFLEGKDGANFAVSMTADSKGGAPTTTGGGGNDGKSCGLFGLELPVLVLLGSAVLFNRKKKNL